MLTNAICFYKSVPDVTFDSLRVVLLLQNEKKCILANSGSYASNNFWCIIESLQLVHSIDICN